MGHTPVNLDCVPAEPFDVVGEALNILLNAFESLVEKHDVLKGGKGVAKAAHVRMPAARNVRSTSS